MNNKKSNWSLKDARKMFVDLTRDQLTGSNLKLKENLLVGEQPLKRFFTGFLFPIYSNPQDASFAEEMEDEDEDEYQSSEEGSDQSTASIQIQKKKKYLPPSSAGMSFFVSGEDISIRVFHNAVSYINAPNRDAKNQSFIKQRWKKTTLTEHGAGEEVEFHENGIKRFIVLDGKARIDALWRPFYNGYIVTITMSNNQVINEQAGSNNEYVEENKKALFEVELKCIIESGDVGVYPAKDRSLLSGEEQEIELRYKDIHIYAVGHGVAVDWTKDKETTDNKMEIWTEFMPAVEVPQVTADTVGKENDTLQFSLLKECNEAVIQKLTDFVNKYEIWIDKQTTLINEEDEEDKATAQKIVKKQIEAKKRMFEGIELLKRDSNARLAFEKANEAMLMQWCRGDLNKGIRKENTSYAWRPFQLAFILMTLESTANDESNFRETLDLIWFPTGGGKTEAYLGLMAFLFVYRRLTSSSAGGGTVAIMRYTLRLLTAQQFLRASKVICALELIRQSNSNQLGIEPFTVGLWIGSTSSPNNFYQVKEKLESEQYSKLILNSCPWCGEPFTDRSYVSSDDDFHFSCMNSACEFGKIKGNVLPCNVVDEALYKRPPSLLIATVDKFARLAWEPRAGSFFGKDGNRPPELIIQDELHLISSALGSIVGLYEVAIDTILASRGVRAKFIASTATIKDAAKQVQALFAKDMAIFPPSGLRYDDSYFAKTVPLDKKAGRLYVGYLAPLLNRQCCLEPLAGALLSNPINLFKDAEPLLDKWWTQVVYHGSLKGTGNSGTIFQSGVLKYLKQFTFEQLNNEIENEFPGSITKYGLSKFTNYEKILDPEIRVIVDKFLPVRDLSVEYLTSKQSAEENAVVFENLVKDREETNAIDVALATNMISVGLDVSRLALMVINGQPLTTAEYIQASSRVGRGETPGIVFVNYYKTQARSLSHYESFRSYHDSFYRHVESSSLTPFTFQARSRALHAALVIAMRHSDIGLLSDDGAGHFDIENENVKKVIKEMKIRCKLAIGNNPELIEAVNKHIDNLTSQWASEIKYNIQHPQNLKYKYNPKDKSFSFLLDNFSETNTTSTSIPWATLQSMRNVEKNALLKLLHGVKDFEK